MWREESDDKREKETDDEQDEIGQEDAEVLLVGIQIVKGDDVIIDMIRHAPGEEGRVLSFQAGKLQVGDVQPVQAEPGEEGEEEKKKSQPQGKIGEGRKAGARRGEEMNELRGKKGEDAPGEDLVDQRADHFPVKTLREPAAHRDASFRNGKTAGRFSLRVFRGTYFTTRKGDCRVQIDKRRG